STQAETRRQLSLVWGVRAAPAPPRVALAALRTLAVQSVTRAVGPLPSGRIVLTAGYPVEGRPTNLVTVVEMGEAPTGRAGGQRGRARR
ncbi:MAG: hypothetical protein L3J91_02815, partial [Thermoplasmata archaeon]|nr:hypothetical protein [Thermoplasmata archaeon]